VRKLVSLLVLLPAILFVGTGVRWLVAPVGVAPEFGLTLDFGVGLSSQVGIMAGFFMTLGGCMLTALVSGRRSWYYPPILLLSITALGRILAWVVHDAALALNLIVPEVIIFLILIAASRFLPESK
jgi:hypothetical protein